MSTARSKSLAAAVADGRVPELVAFGENLQRLCLSVGMRQEDLAVASGLDRVALSRIERGFRDVGVSRIKRLASALGVEPSAFFD